MVVMNQMVVVYNHKLAMKCDKASGGLFFKCNSTNRLGIISLHWHEYRLHVWKIISDFLHSNHI